MTIHLCKNCSGIINEDYIYCPWCGKVIGKDDRKEGVATVPAGVTEIKIKTYSEKMRKLSPDGNKTVNAPEGIYVEALKYVVQAESASVSMIQKKFAIGYVKACKIMDWMKENSFVTPYRAGDVLKVLINPDEVNELFG